MTLTMLPTFGEPMTLRSQVGIAVLVFAGFLLIVYLLQRRRINEGLFYLWLAVLLGMLAVGTSHWLQVGLTRLIGAYDPISTMLLFSLGFLFGATLVFSVQVSSLNSRLRDLTSYVAEIRLDVDEARAGAPERATESEHGSGGEQR